MEALERERHFRPDDGGAGYRTRRTEDRDDPLSSKLRFDCRAVDATYLKAHRTATSMGVKKGARTPDRSDKRRYEPLTGRALQSNVPRGAKLHAICDSQGRPLNLFVTAGQVSDYIGARAMLSSLPKVDWLLVDRGYDADCFREALKDKRIRACIPGRKQRKITVKYDKRRYKQRNRPSRDIALQCTAGQ
ncbi:MAG: transposase [Paracoccaceae bacterium]